MKRVPFEFGEMQAFIDLNGSPFYFYDKPAIQENARRFTKAFSALDFKNYFAVKALPNPHIAKMLHAEGMGLDCSSLMELGTAVRLDITGEDIMFTSNNTAAHEYMRAQKLGAIINMDDITHINFFKKHLDELPDLLSFRYNPGPLIEGNEIIGKPIEAKFGIATDQIHDAYRVARDAGVKRFGLHTMTCSNVKEESAYLKSVDILFSLAVDIQKNLGITFEFVNVGGGVGIPYHLDEHPMDIERLAQGIETLYIQYFQPRSHPHPKIFMECGRYVTGPYGYLVTTVRHFKQTYKNYMGLDASMADLPRPGMYGAYHHITNLSKQGKPESILYDVVGSLCENNDKFAVDRWLQQADLGDIIILHDAGAHCHAMGSQYNGKLRSAEFLGDPRDLFRAKKIRRAETSKDYFATVL